MLRKMRLGGKSRGYCSRVGSDPGDLHRSGTHIALTKVKEDGETCTPSLKLSLESLIAGCLASSYIVSYMGRPWDLK